jgi:hypothetical protein
MRSVLEQDYPNIEYIVIDGAPAMEALKSYRNMRANWLIGKAKRIRVRPMRSTRVSRVPVVKF